MTDPSWTQVLTPLAWTLAILLAGLTLIAGR
jgi:hypothetical protein